MEEGGDGGRRRSTLSETEKENGRSNPNHIAEHYNKTTTQDHSFQVYYSQTRAATAF